MYINSVRKKPSKYFPLVESEQPAKPQFPLPMKLLSVLLLGFAIGLASAETRNTNKSLTYATTTHLKYETAVSAKTKCVLDKNSSTVTGGEVLLSVMEPMPTAALAVSICCDIANGNFWTNVDYGPSKKYKDQRVYICTVYASSDASAPKIVPGNSSTSAGTSFRPPPPDPKCTQKETKVDCLGSSGNAVCAWTGDKCAYEPPLHCGGFDPHKPLGPFCVGIDLAAQPFPSGAAGRKLRAFNWTAGTVGPQQEKVFVQPAQVLQLGSTTWLSVSVDLASGFEVCVTYNELSVDGHSSDPKSGFSACAQLGAGTVDLTRGSTKNLQNFAAYGGSTGWTEKGYKPADGTALWGYFMFWSNTTAL